jgi:uncharacterized protein
LGVMLPRCYRTGVRNGLMPSSAPRLPETGPSGPHLIHRSGGDAAPRNRPALAQAFADGAGGTFIAVVNHLKSKGSACDAPDAGDGQGNCNEVRTRAAQELAAWLAVEPTGTADPDVLILGDLTAYAREDPVNALETVGFVDLLADRIGPAAYTCASDGQWGSLDHALASRILDPQVTGVGVWHINADERSVLDYNTNFKSAGQVASLYAPTHSAPPTTIS